MGAEDVEHERNGNVESALERYRRLVRDNAEKETLDKQTEATRYFQLAEVLIGMGKKTNDEKYTEEAFESIQKAVELAPSEVYWARFISLAKAVNDAEQTQRGLRAIVEIASVSAEDRRTYLSELVDDIEVK